MSKEDVVDILAIDLLGLIVEDPKIISSGGLGTPAVLDNKSPAGRAFYRIARRLLGESVEFPEVEEKKRLDRQDFLEGDNYVYEAEKDVHPGQWKKRANCQKPPAIGN